MDQLERVVSELRVSNILKTDNEKEDLFSKLRTGQMVSELRKGQIEQLNPMAAYLLERILNSYYLDKEKLISQRYNLPRTQRSLKYQEAQYFHIPGNTILLAII